MRPNSAPLATHLRGHRALPMASLVWWFGRTCRPGFALLVGLFLCMGGLARASGTSHALFNFGGPTSVEVSYGSTVSMKGVFSNGTGVIKDQGGTTTFATVVSGTTYTTDALSSNKTYTLTVTNPAGDSVTASVDVTVTQISVGAVTPALPAVTVSGTKQFSATATGGADNGVTWSVDGVLGGNDTVGRITIGGLYTAPATPGSHTITAKAGLDATKFSSTTVTVVAAPVATSLVASNSNPLYGATFTLTPTYANGTGSIDYSVTCPATGVASAAVPTTWSGARTFTLTVTNTAGDSTSTSVIVTGQTVVVAAVSPASKYVTASHSASFSSSVTGALDTSLDWAVDGVPTGNASVGTITSGGIYTAPTTPGTYTITATSHANSGVSRSATVTVVALPTLGSAFTAGTPTVNYGGTTTLTATFSDGTARITGGVSDEAVTSPVSFTTPALTATTTYTLTLTNLAGDTVTTTVTVTVTAVTMSSVTAPKDKVSLTKTLQFSGGSVSNAVNSNVVWKVNGVASGNAELGTISATGLYTAPATMPSMTAPATGGTVIIRCESAANPAVFTELTITLYALPTITSFELL